MPRFLCFSAHPDDAEFGATGTLLKLLDAGWTGALVVVTNGENGFKAGELPPAERIAVRQREQRAAAGLLGIPEVVFLGERDGFLEETEALRARLVEIVRRFKPDRVFSFDPANLAYDDLNLFHRDHRVTGRAVFDALFAARNLWMYPGEPHAVEEVYFFGTDAPNHYEDISAVIDRKIAALACHASQFPDFARVESLVRDVISAPHAGPEGTLRHCERFRIMRNERPV
jgi:LmbE family N-acetylglucosaminyl deacetylase